MNFRGNGKMKKMPGTTVGKERGSARPSVRLSFAWFAQRHALAVGCGLHVSYVRCTTTLSTAAADEHEHEHELSTDASTVCDCKD